MEGTGSYRAIWMNIFCDGVGIKLIKYLPPSFVLPSKFEDRARDNKRKIFKAPIEF